MDFNDKGVRKFLAFWGSVVLIFSGFLLCADRASVYSELCMTLLGALSIFSGSNVLEKWRKPESEPKA